MAELLKVSFTWVERALKVALFFLNYACREISSRQAFLKWESLKSFNPLKPKNKIWIHICCTYSFLTFCPLFISYRSSGENMIKFQANSSCVIMSIILMTTTLFYKVLVLQGEIWCWSLLVLKGLMLWTFNDKIRVR